MQTTKRLLRVERRDIDYIQSTIESYDGMANLSTLDPHAAYMEIRISPGCEDIVLALLDSLKKEGLVLTQKGDREM